MKKNLKPKTHKKNKAISFFDKRIALIGVLIILCIALTLSLYAGGTYAKYKENWSNGAVASAQNFYFESNLLSETSGSTQGYSPGNITFELYNFTDSLRMTGSDIGYSITVNNGTIASVKSGETPVSLNNSLYTMAGNAETTHTVTITPTQTNLPVIVTVAASSPYSKTLSATFNPTVAPTCAFGKVEDNSPSVPLNFSNLSDDTTAIIVTLPADGTLIPDTQDSRVTNYTTNSFTFSAGPGSSSVVLFKKATATKYKATLDIPSKKVTVVKTTN